jgi:N-acetylmuramoyl-L-alanine amidase
VAVVRIRTAWLAAGLLLVGFLVSRPVARSHPVASHIGRWLQGRTIVLDPGHGGYDPGALGAASREADINLAMALQLKAWLVRAGARVLMTWSRPGDIPPNRKYVVAARAAWIRSTHADLLIDVHCNAGPGAWGPQVFYWDGTPSRLLADYVAEELHAFTRTHRPVTRLDQYVLRHAGMPAINVEVGFINNRREERRLLSPAYQRALMWYVFVGVARWFLHGRWPAAWIPARPPTELLVR